MHYKLISLAILLVSLFACKKDEQPICIMHICDDWEYYTSTATINNEILWHAKYCYFEFREDGSLRITLMKPNAFGQYKELITFRLISTNVGIHEVYTGTIPEFYQAEFPIAIYTEGDHDIVGASYYIIEDEGISNYVSITEISPDSSEISGTFNLSFYRNENRPGQVDHSIPDTLHFTEGVFSARKWR